MASDQDAKLCPKCGAIVTSGSENCGVCGADLWETKEESLKVAVHEEEKSEAAVADQLRRKERKNMRRVGMAWLVVYVATAVLILSGLILLIYSPTTLPPSSTPFWTGFVLMLVGFMMLLYVVIGPDPRWRSRGWPRA